MWESFFYYIGIYAFARYAYAHFKSPVLILLSHLKDFLLPMTRKTLKEKYGNWAVVTGSTDGMGKEYARQIALKGFNVVLIARNEDKLKNVKKEIETEANVEVKYIIADFSQGFEIYAKIEKELEHIPVGILVNNVGLSRLKPGKFEDHSQKLIWDMILVNTSSALLMTKIVLPGMKERRRGAIVNVSSICVMAPLIFQASVYSICKVLLSSFTKILQWEMSEYKKIDIQLLEPCFVATKMVDFSPDIKEHYVTASCEEWATSSIDKLGRTQHTNGFYRHSLFAYLFSIFPEQVCTVLIYWYSKTFEIKDD